MRYAPPERGIFATFSVSLADSFQGCIEAS